MDFFLAIGALLLLGLIEYISDSYKSYKYKQTDDYKWFVQQTREFDDYINKK